MGPLFLGQHRLSTAGLRRGIFFFVVSQIKILNYIQKKILKTIETETHGSLKAELKFPNLNFLREQNQKKKKKNSQNSSSKAATNILYQR